MHYHALIDNVLSDGYLIVIKYSFIAYYYKRVYYYLFTIYIIKYQAHILYLCYTYSTYNIYYKSNMTTLIGRKHFNSQ